VTAPIVRPLSAHALGLRCAFSQWARRPRAQVQTIGFLSHLRSKGVHGPFMVVGPLSTLPNWVSEFARWCPSMPCILYHGSKPERTALRSKRMPTGAPRRRRAPPCHASEPAALRKPFRSAAVNTQLTRGDVTCMRLHRGGPHGRRRPPC